MKRNNRLSNRAQRAQRLWASLSKRYGGRKRKAKANLPQEVQVDVVSAVTGEVSKGFMREASSKKLKKWLSYHNIRAQVERMIIPLKSSWARMTDDQWSGYPIIIRVGSYKAPYVVNHISPGVTVKRTTFRTLFLKSVDNISYVEAITVKKKMAQGLVLAIKQDVASAKKEKRQRKARRRKRYDVDIFDD